MGQHFGAAGGGRQLETAGVALLREVGGSLGSPGAMDRLLKALAAGGGSDVSTFEFLSSGAVANLRTHLLGGHPCVAPYHMWLSCRSDIGVLTYMYVVSLCSGRGSVAQQSFSNCHC